MSLTVRGVIDRAMRLNGSLAAGDQPEPDDLTDCLTALNTMKRALFGTIIGGRMSPQAATGTAGQAENCGEYAIPAAAFILTAPSNPKAGARFGVTDPNLNFATNNCVIARGGVLLEGAAANITLSANGAARRWWFRADTANWVREADYVTADDAIEFPDALIAYLPYMLALVIAPEFNTDLRQDVIAGSAEGRAAFARTYARRGRNQVDPPIGVPAPVATP